MRPVGVFRQGPNDRKRYVVQYDNWLDLNETLTNVVMASDGEADLFLVDGYVISSDAKDVVFFASGGVLNKTYTVTVTVTTSELQVKQDTITIKVM